MDILKTPRGERKGYLVGRENNTPGKLTDVARSFGKVGRAMPIRRFATIPPSVARNSSRSRVLTCTRISFPSAISEERVTYFSKLICREETVQMARRV